MLRVTVDAFSGRPDPSWVLTGAEADEILKEVGRNRGAITDVAGGYTGLGFRGVIVEPLSDDQAQALDLPGAFKVGAGGSQSDDKGRELAERLIRSMRKYAPVSPFADGLAPFDQGLERYLLDQLDMPGPQGTGARHGLPCPLRSDSLMGAHFAGANFPNP